MKSIAKLKDRARKHEQQEDWQAAITAYRQVLEAQQGKDESELELGLFNRIGDLYLRVGQTDNAVSFYEQAADKYAEAGFYNNAIALCNKALRHRPERPETYLKLSRLSAEQGFTTDARRWILDYAEREVKRGNVDAALEGLSEFVDSSGDTEVREFLARQLATHNRRDEALAHFVRAHHERLARGETEAAERNAARARTIDPAVDLESGAGAVGPAAGRPSGGGGIAGDLDDDFGAGEPEPLPGLETLEDTAAGADVGGLGGLEGLEPTGGAAAAGEEELEGVELPGLEVSESERGAQEAGEPAAGATADASEGLGGLETFDGLELGELDEVDESGVGVSPVAGGGESADGEPELEPLPFMESGLDEQAEAPDPLPLLDAETEEEPEEELEPELVEPIEAAREAAEEEAEPFAALDFGEDEAAAGVGEAGEEPEPWESADTDTDTGFALDLDLSGGFSLGLGESGAPPPEAAEVDVDAVLTRARELVSRGLGSQALTELSLLPDEISTEVLEGALGVVNEIVRLNPSDIDALHRRVEYADRTGNEAVQVKAYLDVAEALGRSGAETKAEAMYQRVLELDPENQAAREALGAGGESEEEEEAVDLDAILRDMGPGEVPEDAGAGPVPDAGADPEFVAMLSQFKARVNDRGEGEDAGDHYDLGIAFKEMGLIDEAIAEFQTALTGGEERLKVYEELGQCFILKGQYNVALKVFARALQVPHQDESELLGVYYHLGQCHEELGQREQARAAYEKVLGIDASFQDVPDRMARL